MLDGQAGDDKLIGSSGDDQLIGGPGNDTVLGQAGRDRLDGQSGIDTVSFESSIGPINVSLDQRVVIEDGFGSSDAVLKRFENVTGSDFDDQIQGDPGDNILDGRDGTDTIIGLGGNDLILNLGPLTSKPVFDLDPSSDTAPFSDHQTTVDNASIQGTTDPNITVQLLQTGALTTSDGAGRFVFADIPLNLGDNALTVEATDILGSTNSFELTITRVQPAGFLLRDDFNSPSLNSSVWLMPNGPGSTLGRTQFRPLSLPPQITGGVARFQLDTFNSITASPTEPFLGTEIQSIQSFDRGQGLTFEARARVVSPIPKGIVASLFAFALNGQVRDELTFELLTNDLVDGNQRILTNVFDDDPFDDAGDPQFAAVPGLDLTSHNIFRVQWLADRVQWFVNGSLVRQEFQTVPDLPMQVRLNFWAPDPTFVVAFDAGLQPDTSPVNNRTFIYEIDYVEVTRSLIAVP